MAVSLTQKDVRTGVVLIAKWLPEFSYWRHAGIISIEEGKAYVYDNDPDNPINGLGGSVQRGTLEEYLKERAVMEFYDSGATSEQIQKRAQQVWHKKFNWVNFNCETFIKQVTGVPIKRTVLHPMEKIALSASALILVALIIYFYFKYRIKHKK
jgi:hypothetical protein